MIIGQFSDIFPSYRDGVAYVQDSYCRELAKRGHDTYYISPWYSHTSNDINCATLLYKSIGLPKEHYRLGLPFLDKKYNDKIKQIPFDIVHTHSPFAGAIAASKVSKTLNIPLVSTFHSKYYDDLITHLHSKTLVKTVINKIVNFYNKCNEVWTVNESTAQTLNDYGYKKEIVIMENGVSVAELTRDAIDAIRATYKIPADVPTLLYVGQIHAKKNVSNILRACEILKKQGFKFHLLIVGDGPQKKELEQLAKSLNVENDVSFLGFITNKEHLMGLYCLSKLLILPSYYDTFSLVIREAASNKTPSLVLKGSDASALIKDGHNGYLAQDDSPQSIAETILQSMESSDDVGLNAFNTLVSSWDEIIDVVEKRYKNLIAMNKINKIAMEI